MSLEIHAVAEAFVAFTCGSGHRLRELLTDDVVDHVSGRTGKEIWDVVGGWLRASFADIEVELHAVGAADDGRVMIWITTHGTHVGSAFPWMRGRSPSGRRVAWSQVHVFRREAGHLVEHWAVRDDLRVLEAIDGV
jgi:predicted ester cyclase